MGIFDYFKQKKALKKAFEEKKEELELEFMKERHEQKLDLDRRKKEIDLIVAEKRAELERERLEYQIQEQKSRLQEAMADEYDENDEHEQDSPEMRLIAPIVANLLNKNTQSNLSINNSKEQSTLSPKIEGSGLVSYTDEEIEAIYQNADKKYITMARGMPDSVIATFIKQKIPNIDEDTLKRAIVRVKR